MWRPSLTPLKIFVKIKTPLQCSNKGKIIKTVLKKLIIKLLKLNINKKNILSIRRHNLPLVKEVYISDNKNKIYLLKTKWSYVLNLDTVKTLIDYNIYLDLNLFITRYQLRIPMDIVQKLSMQSYYKQCMQLPLQKNLIVFESFFGKNYSGQPKYLYEYLLEHNPSCTFVWVYQKDPQNIPGNPIIVKRGSREYFHYLATAQYWVNNIIFPIHKKRSETIYVQTWHGTPLKRLGYDIEVDGPEVNVRENFYKESRNWDYLLTQNAYTSEILQRAFKFDKEIIEEGYPHSDFLINATQKRAEQIKKSLELPLDKKIILYAPTWRDNDTNGNWSFNFTLKINLKKWQEQLGEEYIILIRMHHLITNIKDLDEVEGFAYNLSTYDDIQELSLISDILITDYSSVFFDFGVTKKPILFYTYDFEEYSEKLRGFYLDMKSDLPGPIIQEDAALLDAIINIKSIEVDYAEAYNTFIKRFCYLDNGHSTERVAKKVFKELHV